MGLHNIDGGGHFGYAFVFMVMTLAYGASLRADFTTASTSSRVVTWSMTASSCPPVTSGEVCLLTIVKVVSSMLSTAMLITVAAIVYVLTKTLVFMTSTL